MSKVPMYLRPATNPEATDATDEAEVSTGRLSSAQEGAPEPEKDVQSLEAWRDRALRFQAEMENYRKRQRRWAEAQINMERERLLRAFTHLVDDLQRALTADHTDMESLRSGVALTYRAFMNFLGREGVTLLQPAGQRFDPELHEAVGTVSHLNAGVKVQTVVEVMERGYLLGDRLLQPARVIVAV